MNVLLVTATPATREGFRFSTGLGRSIQRMAGVPGLQCSITCENTLRLPEVYNSAICEANRGKVLLFIHDDVFIDDFWLVHRLQEASQQFDIVGLAGCIQAAPGHAGWAFTGLARDGSLLRDRAENLSGRVCHRIEDQDVLSQYGPAPRECQLLDGLFLAVKADSLLDRGVRFDPRFAYHFYDLDFCRACSQKGLRLGTWPIAVTHGSRGGYGTPEWRKGLAEYHRKWGPQLK